ncbi:Isochorismatase family protein yecD [Serratia ficaria]|uniref:cysteine hydrolase family protein n=1 Tax=Serratia ficaria TaxID=61651 RepID=UPI002177DE29|nr:cysteine hydrolase family protein [Serratia ficaria]CAI1254712.1 Isochorismatase family protein yecD [Serratia ficaria]CAI1864362.1 Isochorismatase family protein yecD [Serratia ficaria]CAI2537194.1 Isochorismatase family protein yecD [Serratia ficaria]CAI2537629.1 Isochorismatase family protein yecD [Serratia ficaria]CAI2540297.1 Isochorismatase family protein yecD [Serratia ficaria]
MNSSEKALLVIDMQQGLFRGPISPHFADVVLSNICLLIEKAKQAQVPVFFARHTGPDDSPFSEQSSLTQLISEMNVNAERDVVFIKKYPSCFRDTGLQLQLSRRGVRQLVIAGMKTEFCVDTTCRAAPELGFKAVLISDAHTTMDNEYLSANKIIEHHNITLAGPFVTLATAADWSFHS